MVVRGFVTPDGHPVSMRYRWCSTESLVGRAEKMYAAAVELVRPFKKKESPRFW